VVVTEVGFEVVVVVVWVVEVGIGVVVVGF